MIEGLSSDDLDFLRSFYSAPNGLEWDALNVGTAPQQIVDVIRPWVQRLASGDLRSPTILPFVRNGEITGWYATSRTPEGASTLGAELDAWIGPSYWTVSTVVGADARDSMAKSMRDRFGNAVYRFAGPDSGQNAAIASRLGDFSEVLKMRPTEWKHTIRPFGSIRGDFDRSVLARDEARAEELIGELRATGRLNEENLRYLDVRVKAGLGYWQQIARDHWLVSTLSDLALPPQSLADIVEALYRTYVDETEEAGSADDVLNAFDVHVARRYPRLFATRRGLRNPRVLKAFILFERLRPNADVNILQNLAALLPTADREARWVREVTTDHRPLKRIPNFLEADEAFEDESYDRAFEYYLACSFTGRSLARLLQCIAMIDTDEAKIRLIAAIDEQSDDFSGSLTPKLKSLIDAIREQFPATGQNRVTGWMGWAEQIAEGRDLAGAEASVRDTASSWDVEPFARVDFSRSFAALVGNADGASASLVRQSVPYMIGAFFPEDRVSPPGLLPIASTIFMLILMGDRLNGVDLELLAQLLDQMLAAGLSEKDYLSSVVDLEDVLERVGSYSQLRWSLDICEALAVAPSPSASAREARLRFFSKVVASAQTFAHRLERDHLVAIRFLARDFGVDPTSLEVLRSRPDVAAGSSGGLSGKKIGIYTLAESAGSRAKAALEEMYPGCIVELNSDLVATARLTNLAATADLFLFAWKASSHAAFDCIQEAMPRGSKPIFPPGKGTASMLSAVKETLR